jgi:S1-C subfamily serine protease
MGRCSTKLIVCWAFWLLAALCMTAGAAEKEQPRFRDAMRAARQSVVVVECYLRHPVAEGEMLRTINTGFFVSEDGHVLTSMLAVTGAAQVRVRRPNEKPADVELWALDQACGLALLKADLKNTPCLTLNEDAPEAGQWILAAHATTSPEEGAGMAVRPAMLSATDATLKFTGAQWKGLMRFELDAHAGCAAAPVLDENGGLVGVVISGRAWRSGGECCYALPAGSLKPVLASLMTRKTRRVGWLGVALAHAEGMEGLTIEGVIDGSPAQQAGIRPGDVLLDMDGKTIDSPDVFESKIAASAPGSRITMAVQQQGNQVKTISVQVGTRPLMISSMPVPVPPQFRSFGREFRPATVERRTQESQEDIIRRLTQENSLLREKLKKQEKEQAETPGRKSGHTRTE